MYRLYNKQKKHGIESVSKALSGEKFSCVCKDIDSLYNKLQELKKERNEIKRCVRENDGCENCFENNDNDENTRISDSNLSDKNDDKLSNNNFDSVSSCGVTSHICANGCECEKDEK